MREIRQRRPAIVPEQPYQPARRLAQDEPKMMPGQDPYTAADLDALYGLVADAATGDPGEANEPPSCVDCEGKHPDYRSGFGHLDMDPVSSATILVEHRR